jgi:hypothetical protein
MPIAIHSLELPARIRWALAPVRLLVVPQERPQALRWGDPLEQ